MLLRGREPAWKPVHARTRAGAASHALAVASARASRECRVTLAEKARESGCTSKPVADQRCALFKCTDADRAATPFFNVARRRGHAAEPIAASATGARKSPTSRTPTPPASRASTPRRRSGRDDMRQQGARRRARRRGEARWPRRACALRQRRARAAARGADRRREVSASASARLRQAVQLHERNVEALKKELGDALKRARASRAAAACRARLRANC